MKDIFEAMEKLSAGLSFAIQRVAQRKGWASKPYSVMLAPSPERTIIVVSTSVHLPMYRSAAIMPRYEPENGQMWQFEVRRTDGVIRDSWADGLTLSKSGGSFEILYGAIAVTDESLDMMLDDLGVP
jgi:hypothetical protein